MPRLNRLRVTNIQYDHGKKQLPDLIFEAKGLDALFVLANGGGKSLLVQLMLQVILPNCRMGKRPLGDLLLAGNYTGHVALEWLLDGAGKQRQFLCTGFCFSGSSSGDRPLRYYNYLFDYPERAKLTLEDLPLLVSEGESGPRPIRYQELKDWLREKGIQPIERVETYQERLRVYQILPEEWRNIQKTNGEEGGVDKFFEKSKTTRQLMDNLLIPSVEEMIFQDEQKKQELVHAFTQYREMLLEIPVIKQNLHDFALMRDAAEEVVAAGEVLHRCQKKLQEQIKEIVRLARSFFEFSEEAQKNKEKLLQEEETLVREEQQLNWQERSYQWFKQRLELERSGQEEVEAQQAYQVAEDVKRQAEKEEKELLALYYYREATKAAQEKAKFQQQLALMDQAEPELKVLLTEQQKMLRFAWEKQKEVLAQKKHCLAQSLEELEEEKDRLTEEGQAKRLIERKLTKELALLENWFAEYAQKREELLKLVEINEVLEPQVGLQKQQAVLKQQIALEQEIITEEEELQSEKEKIVAQLFSGEREKYELETELKGLAEKKVIWRKETEALQGLLAEQNLYCDSLLGAREKIGEGLADLLNQLAERQASFQAELANWQERWALLAHRDYYIPHHDLLKLKRRLEKAGIYTVLGSEWLAEQMLSAEEKEAILQGQPFLPFSILLETQQVNVVKQLLKQSREWTCDLPLLFLVKSGDFLQSGAEGSNFFPLWAEDLYFFRPDTSLVYTSQTALEQLKSRLQEKIEGKQSALAQEVEQERLLLGLQERLASFYRQYSAEMVQEWQQSKVQLETAVLVVEQEIAQAKAEQLEIPQKEAALKKQLQAIALQKEALQKIIEKLVAFQTLHLLFAPQEIERKKVTEELGVLIARLTEIEERRFALSELTVTRENQLQEAKQVAEKHEADFVQYNLASLEPCQTVATYEAARLAVEGILARLHEKQSERTNIAELFSKTNKQYEAALFEIKRTGIAEAWLQAQRRVVSRQEISTAGETTGQAVQQCQQKKELWEEAQVVWRTAQKLLEHLAAEIKQDFAREPYASFTAAAHLLELEGLKERQKQLKKQINEVSQKIRREAEWQKETWDVYEIISGELPDEIRVLGDQVKLYTKAECLAQNKSLHKLFMKYNQLRNELVTQIEKQKNVVAQRFEQYLRKLETTNNVKMNKFIRDVKAMMAEQRLYDYEFIQDQFLRIFEGLEQYENQYQHTLAECEKNKQHLVDLCLRRALTVYESVCQIPKNSRVEIFGRTLQVIRLDWPRREESETWERLHSYVEQALTDLQIYKQEGKTDDEIDRIMATKLETGNLIEQIAPLGNCRVTVYKPRSKAVLEHGKLDYYSWDEVPKWSGGEEYSIYMTMFMVLLTHIRQQLEGWQHAWKVLVADNPFGKAPSAHVWEMVFQIAQANRIQLICFTPHQGEGLLKRFPVVYSLQLRNAYGKEIMQKELLESGFYRLDTDSQMKLSL